MKSIIKLDIVDIKGDGYHVFVPVTINNHIVHLLIDTGASRSAFDMNTLKIILGESDFQQNEQLTTGLGTKTMESFFAHIDTMMIGELLITDYTAVLLDLTHVNETYTGIGMEPIVGVIGGDILMKYMAVINYKKKELTLYSKKNTK